MSILARSSFHLKEFLSCVYTMQPVVQPVVQRVVSCIRGFTGREDHSMLSTLGTISSIPTTRHRNNALWQPSWLL